MIRKKTISKGIGALDSSAWSSIVQCVDAFESKRFIPDESVYASTSRTILVKITDFLILSGNGEAKWQYSWSQARQAGQLTFSTDDISQITSDTVGYGKALNLREAGNTTSLTYGIPTSNLEIISSPGYFFSAVPINSYQFMTMMRDATGTLRFLIDAPNIISGACPAPSPSPVVGSSDAGTLTGTTLAGNVVNSSLQTVGVLAELAVLDLIDADLAGNAYTADTLSSARSITLAGEASGTTSFNGSSNVTITTTIPLLDGGNY